MSEVQFQRVLGDCTGGGVEDKESRLSHRTKPDAVCVVYLARICGRTQVRGTCRRAGRARGSCVVCMRPGRRAGPAPAAARPARAQESQGSGVRCISRFTSLLRLRRRNALPLSFCRTGSQEHGPTRASNATHARPARCPACPPMPLSTEHGPWAWPIPERESMKPYVSRSLQLKDLDAVIRFELRSAGRVVDDNVKGFVHVKQSFERIHRL